MTQLDKETVDIVTALATRLRGSQPQLKSMDGIAIDPDAVVNLLVTVLSLFGITLPDQFIAIIRLFLEIFLGDN